MKELKILDASCLAKIILQEDGWELVPLDENTFTLDFAFVEVMNVIWKAIITNRIEEEDELERCNILKEIHRYLPVRDSSKYFSKALKISIGEKITIYDSLYIAAGIFDSATLYTSDKNRYNVATRYLKAVLIE